MEITSALIEQIRPGNVRVPRAQFEAVWAAAERRCTEQAERGVTDWYAGGVAVTCRWLAGAVVEDERGHRKPEAAPATGRTESAYEESIEAEFLAAETLGLRCPDLVEHQPGWCEAIRATLRWSWRHEGPPPLAGCPSPGPG